MAVYSAKELVRIFTDRYQPEDQVAITWWDKTDVEIYADEANRTVEDLWDEVIDDADNALEECIGTVNDSIQFAIGNLEEN